MSEPIPDFDDIRPYRDDEVRGVLDRLSADAEFLDTLVGLKLPWLKSFGFGLGFGPWVGRYLVGLSVRRLFSRIHTVRDFQQLVSAQLRAQMQKASTGFRALGLEALEPDQSYLFISNHRDIAMDPAVVDLVLEDHGMDTVRIAIGDNLLTKAFVSDLMRVNKSFIVKRSPVGRREKLSSLKQLSAYIRYSVGEDNSSVWIAQREGRAKDGIDKTETAMLKMLALSKEKGQSFSQALAGINIVPVAISYEFDPCDRDKTRELHALRTQGRYQKAQYEDLHSIREGIVGDKGQIIVAFGEPLTAGFETADELAAAIDRQIISHYQLQAPHLIAYQLLHGVLSEDGQSEDEKPGNRLLEGEVEIRPEIEQWKAALSETDWQLKKDRFLQRLQTIPQVEQDIFLAMYANPVEQRLRLQSASLETTQLKGDEKTASSEASLV